MKLQFPQLQDILKDSFNNALNDPDSVERNDTSKVNGTSNVILSNCKTSFLQTISNYSKQIILLREKETSKFLSFHDEISVKREQLIAKSSEEEYLALNIIKSINKEYEEKETNLKENLLLAIDVVIKNESQVLSLSYLNDLIKRALRYKLHMKNPHSQDTSSIEKISRIKSIYESFTKFIQLTKQEIAKAQTILQDTQTNQLSTTELENMISVLKRIQTDPLLQRVCENDLLLSSISNVPDLISGLDNLIHELKPIAEKQLDEIMRITIEEVPYIREPQMLIQRMYREEVGIANFLMPDDINQLYIVFTRDLEIAWQYLIENHRDNMEMCKWQGCQNILNACYSSQKYLEAMYNSTVINSQSIIKKGLNNLFQSLFRYADKLEQDQRDQCINAIGFIISSIIKNCSTQQMKEQIGSRLKAWLYRHDCRTIPIFSVSNDSTKTFSLKLLAAIINCNSVSDNYSFQENSHFSFSEVWSWIVRVCNFIRNSLCRLIKCDNIKSQIYLEYLQNSIDSFLLVVPLISRLFLNASRKNFFALLSQFESILIIKDATVVVDSKRLLNLHTLLKELKQACSSNNLTSFVGHSWALQGVHCFVLDQIVAFKIDHILLTGCAIDSMKPMSVELKQKISYFKINRLQGMFNRLTPETEQHTKFASEAFEMLQNVQKHEGTTSPLLQYLLYRLVSLVITNSQEECVSVKRKTTTLKLARVSSLLCSSNHSLVVYFRKAFHKHCPFTIPLLLPYCQETDKDEAFFDIMQFQMKGNVLEKNEKWCDRMLKTFCIYCQIMIQDEQTPFTIADGWRWLALFCNSLKLYSSFESYHRSYVIAIAGDFLDIFLRITSEKMLQVYGSTFFRLLQAIHSQLLPLLIQKATGTKRLVDLLVTILNSGGKTIPSLYDE